MPYNSFYYTYLQSNAVKRSTLQYFIIHTYICELANTYKNTHAYIHTHTLKIFIQDYQNLNYGILHVFTVIRTEY